MVDYIKFLKIFYTRLPFWASIFVVKIIVLNIIQDAQLKHFEVYKNLEFNKNRKKTKCTNSCE